jgi:hypothetical protein
MIPVAPFQYFATEVRHGLEKGVHGEYVAVIP